MREKLIMENENFRLLPKAVRQLLIHSETFFFAESGPEGMAKDGDNKPAKEEDRTSRCGKVWLWDRVSQPARLLYVSWSRLDQVTRNFKVSAGGHGRRTFTGITRAI